MARGQPPSSSPESSGPESLPSQESGQPVPETRPEFEPPPSTVRAVNNVSPSISLSTAGTTPPTAVGPQILPSDGNDTTDPSKWRGKRPVPGTLLGSSKYFQIRCLEDDERTPFARKQLVDKTSREERLHGSIEFFKKNREMPEGRKRRQIEDLEDELAELGERRRLVGLILCEEGTMLADMYHTHIIKLLQASSTDPPYLDLDLYDISMEEYLELRQGIDDLTLRKSLLHRLGCFACATAYVHWKGYLHVDIKPQNFLWRDKNICLADFGSFRYLSGKRRRLGGASANGNQMYEAYEVFNGESNLSTASDVAALGFCLIEFYTFICNDPNHPLKTLRYYPSEGGEHETVTVYAAKLDWVKNEWLDKLENCSQLTTAEEHEHIKKELKKMIDKDASKRPDAKDLNFLNFACDECRGGNNKSNARSANDVSQSGTWQQFETPVHVDETQPSRSGSDALDIPPISSAGRDNVGLSETRTSQASSVPTLVDDLSTQTSSGASEALAAAAPLTNSFSAETHALSSRVQPLEEDCTRTILLPHIRVIADREDDHAREGNIVEVDD